MFVRFSVANHLSIRDENSLSFVASSSRDNPAILLPCPVVASKHLLPAALIYGANASGKSNIISALYEMRQMVLDSHSRGPLYNGVFRHPFVLDNRYRQSISKYEIDFVMGGVLNRYGFTATDEEFESEWLYSFPNVRRRVLFERTDGRFVFGRELKGQNTSIAKLTRPDSLFLSAAAQNGHETLSHIFDFFAKILIISTLTAQLRHDLDPRVINFLKDIDTGITGSRRSKIGEIPEDLPFSPTFSSSRRALAMSRIMWKDQDRLELSHQCIDGQEKFLDIEEESMGTRRLVVLLDAAFQALEEGRPLFVDEFDASLHSHACEAVLGLFCSRKSNPNCAQILATVHNTSLINSPFLRRDQLWFVEKDQYGASKLYPLTDYRTRKGDDFELGYLQGRYGAVPLNTIHHGVEVEAEDSGRHDEDTE